MTEVEVPARKSICMVVSSVELTAEWFLLEHIAAMSKTYDVSLVGNCRDSERLRRRGIDAEVVFVPIVREISLLKDLVALLALFQLFRKRRFDIVHSVSPKAGLLAMMAARLSSIPVRIHTFTGQVWATRTGLARVILKSMDRLLAACATNILVDSHAQMKFLLGEKVLQKGKAAVLANGSIKGVDTERFRPRQHVREAMRTKLKVPQGAVVFAYVGRLKRDKGVLDLARAFSMVCQELTEAYLVVVGVDEENLKPEIEKCCADCRARVRMMGQSSAPEEYLACADILCLPSYREGFPSIVIEAAACEVPAIASRIYGIADTLQEGVTGMFHIAGDVRDLASRMVELAQNPALRIAMGKRARARAIADFSSGKVTSALLRYYACELGTAEGEATGRARPPRSTLQSQSTRS